MGNEFSIVHQKAVRLNIHQIWQHLWLIYGDQFFMCSRNIVHIKVPYFPPPSAKCPWKSTSSNTSAGRFPPETNIFNSGILEIVAPSSINNNPKISDYFWSKSSYFPCSDNELHPKYPYILVFFLSFLLLVWPPRFQSLLIMGWCSSKTRA